ncbi:recombinase family protein, partial [Actinomyces sp.]
GHGHAQPPFRSSRLIGAERQPTSDCRQSLQQSRRLFFHMLAAIAEFEHDLIVERTHDGLAAARARGRKGGPKFKMTPTKIRQARAMYDEGGHTVQEIADTFGVSRPTIYRHLAEHVERS